MNPGDPIGHYRILGLLGQGGMGEVYLADDMKLHRQVALKLLPAALAADPERRKRFEREAQSVAALNHPNIVTIYSVEEEDGVPFLTMERVEGQSLRQAMPKGGASTDVLLRLGMTMSDALASAHQRGIIHRDLKPGNVMVMPDGRIKVLDFGLAKLHEAAANQPSDASTKMASDDLTGEGRIVGTVAYMSPEQAEGKPVDQRSDIFSLGVMLHEMATGERPFKGDTDISIISAILKDTPASVSDARPDLPGVLTRIVKRCLAKDPLRRYQSARDLHHDFEELKQDVDSGIALAPSQTAVVAAAAASRPRASRRNLYAAGTAILLLCAAAAWFTLGRHGAEPRRFEADQFTRLTDTGTASQATLSRDGRYVVHVKLESNLPGLWLRQTDSASDVRIVAPAQARFAGMTFSPEGTFVYYVSYPGRSGVGTLYKIPVLGGAPVRILDGVDSVPAFSPDGARFAFMRGEPAKGVVALMVANADGSGARRMPDPPASSRFDQDRAPWSPDGRTIVATERTNTNGVGRSRLEAIDVASGRMTPFGGDWDYIHGVDWMPDGRSVVISAADVSDPQVQLWQVDWPTSERHRITSGVNDYDGVSLSADGRTIATVEGDRHSNIWVVPLGGGAARQITSAVRGNIGGGGLAWTPDGRLVYAAQVGVKNQLWIMGADGSGARQVTNAKGSAARPNVSSDGTWVYYDAGEDRLTINKMALAGGDPRPITPGPLDFRPLVSPDGKWVYYTTSVDGRSRGMKVASDGGTPIALTPPELGFSPVQVSPDGTRLIGPAWNGTSHRSERAFVPVDGGPLAFATDDVPQSARWLPDGKSWLHGDLRQGAGGLFTKPIAGGTERKVLDLGDDQSWAVAIASDGRKLAVVRGRTTNDVVLIKAK